MSNLFWVRAENQIKTNIHDENTLKKILKLTKNDQITENNNKVKIPDFINDDCLELFESLCNVFDMPENWYEYPKWNEFHFCHSLMNCLEFYKYEAILNNVVMLLLENYPFNNMLDDGHYQNIVDMYYFLNKNRQTYDIHRYFYFRFLTIRDNEKRFNMLKSIIQSNEFKEVSLNDKIQISNEFLQIIDDNISTFSDERICDIFCKNINELETEMNEGNFANLNRNKNVFVNGITKKIIMSDALCNKEERANRVNTLLGDLVTPELLKEKIIIAGGCVHLMVDKLCDPLDDNFKNTDIDIFVFGKTEDERMNTTKNVIKYYCDKYNNNIYCVNRRSVACLYFVDKRRTVQIICGKFYSPLDILLSFDFTNIKWFYNSNGIFGLYSSFSTLFTRIATKRHNHLADFKRLYKVYVRQYNIQEFPHNQLKTNIPVNKLFDNYISEEISGKHFDIDNGSFQKIFQNLEENISRHVRCAISVTQPNGNIKEYLIGTVKINKLKYIFGCLHINYNQAMKQLLNKDVEADSEHFNSMIIMISNKFVYLNNKLEDLPVEQQPEQQIEQQKDESPDDEIPDDVPDDELNEDSYIPDDESQPSEEPKNNESNNESNNELNNELNNESNNESNNQILTTIKVNFPQELATYIIPDVDPTRKLIMNMAFIMKTIKHKKMKYHKYYPKSEHTEEERLYMLSLFEHIKDSKITKNYETIMQGIQLDGDFRDNFETCYSTTKDKEMLKEDQIVLLNREYLADENNFTNLQIIKNKPRFKKYEMKHTLRINLPIMKCYEVNQNYKKGLRLFLISNEYKEVNMLTNLEEKIKTMVHNNNIPTENCYFNSIIKKNRYQDWWRKAPEIIDQMINLEKLKLDNDYDKDKLYYNAKIFYERNKKHFEDIGNPLWKNKPTERDFLKTVRIVVSKRTKIILGTKSSTATILKTLDLTRAEFQVTLDLKYISIHQQKHTNKLVIRPVYEAKYVTLLVNEG
jgi:hypothetical protein